MRFDYGGNIRCRFGSFDSAAPTFRLRDECERVTARKRLLRSIPLSYSQASHDNDVQTPRDSTDHPVAMAVPQFESLESRRLT